MQNQINISPKVILPLLSVIATTIIQSPGLRPESSLTQNIIALAKIKKKKNLFLKKLSVICPLLSVPSDMW